MLQASILAARRLHLAALASGLVALFVCAGASAQAPSLPGSTLAPAAEAPGSTKQEAPNAPPDAATETPTVAQPLAAPPDENVEPIDAPTEAPAPQSAASGNRAELERRLQALEFERAHWTNFWPWLAVGTGMGLTAIGSGVGVGAAFSCKENSKCSSPAWATLFVVVGLAIVTGGTLWLVRTDQGIHELEIQTNRVKTDLDQLNHVRLERDRGYAKLDTPLQLDLRF